MQGTAMHELVGQLFDALTSKEVFGAKNHHRNLDLARLPQEQPLTPSTSSSFLDTGSGGIGSGKTSFGSHTASIDSDVSTSKFNLRKAVGASGGALGSSANAPDSSSAIGGIFANFTAAIDPSASAGSSFPGGPRSHNLTAGPRPHKGSRHITNYASLELERKAMEKIMKANPDITEAQMKLAAANAEKAVLEEKMAKLLFEYKKKLLPVIGPQGVIGITNLDGMKRGAGIDDTSSTNDKREGLVAALTKGLVEFQEEQKTEKASPVIDDGWKSYAPEGNNPEGVEGAERDFVLTQEQNRGNMEETYTESGKRTPGKSIHIPPDPYHCDMLKKVRPLEQEIPKVEGMKYFYNTDPLKASCSSSNYVCCNGMYTDVRGTPDQWKMNQSVLIDDDNRESLARIRKVENTTLDTRRKWQGTLPHRIPYGEGSEIGCKELDDNDNVDWIQSVSRKKGYIIDNIFAEDWSAVQLPKFGKIKKIIWNGSNEWEDWNDDSYKKLKKSFNDNVVELGTHTASCKRLLVSHPRIAHVPGNEVKPKNREEWEYFRQKWKGDMQRLPVPFNFGRDKYGYDMVVDAGYRLKKKEDYNNEITGGVDWERDFVFEASIDSAGAFARSLAYPVTSVDTDLNGIRVDGKGTIMQGHVHGLQPGDHILRVDGGVFSGVENGVAFGGSTADFQKILTAAWGEKGSEVVSSGRLKPPVQFEFERNGTLQSMSIQETDRLDDMEIVDGFVSQETDISLKQHDRVLSMSSIDNNNQVIRTVPVSQFLSAGSTEAEATSAFKNQVESLLSDLSPSGLKEVRINAYRDLQAPYVVKPAKVCRTEGDKEAIEKFLAAKWKNNNDTPPPEPFHITGSLEECKAYCNYKVQGCTGFQYKNDVKKCYFKIGEPTEIVEQAGSGDCYLRTDSKAAQKGDAQMYTLKHWMATVQPLEPRYFDNEDIKNVNITPSVFAKCNNGKVSHKPLMKIGELAKICGLATNGMLEGPRPGTEFYEDPYFEKPLGMGDDFYGAIEKYWELHPDPKGPRKDMIVELNPIKLALLPRKVKITDDMNKWLGRIVRFDGRTGGYKIQEYNHEGVGGHVKGWNPDPSQWQIYEKNEFKLVPAISRFTCKLRKKEHCSVCKPLCCLPWNECWKWDGEQSYDEPINKDKAETKDWNDFCPNGKRYLKMYDEEGTLLAEGGRSEAKELPYDGAWMKMMLEKGIKKKKDIMEERAKARYPMLEHVTRIDDTNEPPEIFEYHGDSKDEILTGKSNFGGSGSATMGDMEDADKAEFEEAGQNDAGSQTQQGGSPGNAEWIMIKRYYGQMFNNGIWRQPEERMVPVEKLKYVSGVYVTCGKREESGDPAAIVTDLKSWPPDCTGDYFKADPEKPVRMYLTPQLDGIDKNGRRANVQSGPIMKDTLLFEGPLTSVNDAKRLLNSMLRVTRKLYPPPGLPFKDVDANNSAECSEKCCASTTCMSFDYNHQRSNNNCRLIEKIDVPKLFDLTNPHIKNCKLDYRDAGVPPPAASPLWVDYIRPGAGWQKHLRAIQGVDDLPIFPNKRRGIFVIYKWYRDPERTQEIGVDFVWSVKELGEKYEARIKENDAIRPPLGLREHAIVDMKPEAWRTPSDPADPPGAGPTRKAEITGWDADHQVADQVKVFGVEGDNFEERKVYRKRPFDDFIPPRGMQNFQTCTLDRRVQTRKDEIRVMDAKTKEVCALLCEDTPNCKSFDFLYPWRGIRETTEGNCHLYSRHSAEMRLEDVTYEKVKNPAYKGPVCPMLKPFSEESTEPEHLYVMTGKAVEPDITGSRTRVFCPNGRMDLYETKCDEKAPKNASGVPMADEEKTHGNIAYPDRDQDGKPDKDIPEGDRAWEHCDRTNAESGMVNPNTQASLLNNSMLATICEKALEVPPDSVCARECNIELEGGGKEDVIGDGLRAEKPREGLGNDQYCRKKCTAHLGEEWIMPYETLPDTIKQIISNDDWPGNDTGTITGNENKIANMEMPPYFRKECNDRFKNGGCARISFEQCRRDPYFCINKASWKCMEENDPKIEKRGCCGPPPDVPLRYFCNEFYRTDAFFSKTAEEQQILNKVHELWVKRETMDRDLTFDDIKEADPTGKVLKRIIEDYYKKQLPSGEVLAAQAAAEAARIKAEVKAAQAAAKAAAAKSRGELDEVVAGIAAGKSTQDTKSKPAKPGGSMYKTGAKATAESSKPGKDSAADQYSAVKKSGRDPAEKGKEDDPEGLGKSDDPDEEGIEVVTSDLKKKTPVEAMREAMAAKQEALRKSNPISMIMLDPGISRGIRDKRGVLGRPEYATNAVKVVEDFGLVDWLNFKLKKKGTLIENKSFEARGPFPSPFAPAPVPLGAQPQTSVFPLPFAQQQPSRFVATPLTTQGVGRRDGKAAGNPTVGYDPFDGLGGKGKSFGDGGFGKQKKTSDSIFLEEEPFKGHGEDCRKIKSGHWDWGGTGEHWRKDQLFLFARVPRCSIDVVVAGKHGGNAYSTGGKEDNGNPACRIRITSKMAVDKRPRKKPGNRPLEVAQMSPAMALELQ